MERVITFEADIRFAPSINCDLFWNVNQIDVRSIKFCLQNDDEKMTDIIKWMVLTLEEIHGVQ